MSSLADADYDAESVIFKSKRSKSVFVKVEVVVISLFGIDTNLMGSTWRPV